MKFKFYVLIFILALSFNSASSQNVKYVPSSAKMVMSFNINQIINKLGKNYEEVITDIIKISGEKVNYRDGKLIEKFINSLDLNEDIRIIMYDEKNFSIVVPYRDIKELKEVIYESFEDSHIKNYFSGGIQYLEIDETAVMALGNNVLCVSYSEYGTYTAHNYLNEIVNNASPIRDRAFLELEKKVNDASLWVDLDYLFEEYMTDDDYYNYNDNIFNNSSIAASLNFNRGNITVDIESYFPKSPFGNIKKKLDSKIAKLLDAYDITGFSSFSFNPRKFNEIIKNNFAYTEIDKEMKKEIENGVTGYDLIEMFNGDCSIITINDSDSIKFISALSLKNQNQFINLIEKNQNNIRKIGNNEYWIEDGEFNLYISNSTAYICDLSLNKLKNILNSQSNSNNNSRFAINNDISFFIDVNKAYNLIKENNELDILMNELHYISGAINIKNNYGFKGYIRLNFKNENSLASFIKILSKIEY